MSAGASSRRRQTASLPGLMIKVNKVMFPVPRGLSETRNGLVLYYAALERHGAGDGQRVNKGYD